jgi:endonuclease/exonuclease/phosphatase (EEP) superfamily protein YafD
MARYNKYKKPLFSRYLVRLVVFITLCILLSLLAPFGWPFELLSHFVVQYAFLLVGLGVWLLLTKRTRWALFTFMVCATQLYQIIPFWQSSSEVVDTSSMKTKDEDVRILQFNVDHNNDNINNMAHWVISHSEDIDIVVLLEVTDKWQIAIERIKWSYPYHISKKVRGERQIVVLSRLLIDELEVQKFAEGVSGIVLRGATINGDAPFVLYSVHPAPPIFPGMAKQRNEVLLTAAKKIFKEEAKYKILVGDFNTTPFSPYFKKIEKASGLYDSNEGMGTLGTWPSFVPKLLGIAIDNMLVSKWIRVENKQLGPAMGSDHYPVITTLKFIIPDNGD